MRDFNELDCDLDEILRDLKALDLTDPEFDAIDIKFVTDMIRHIEEFQAAKKVGPE